MNEHEIGRLMQLAESMEKNISTMTTEIKLQNDKLTRIETVLFDDVVGIMGKFAALSNEVEEIKKYITSQKAYIFLLSGLGAGGVMFAKYVFTVLKALH